MRNSSLCSYLAAPVTALLVGMLLGTFPDRSNALRMIGSSYALPVAISVLVAKYIQGDWDEGYTWNLWADLTYWVVVISAALSGVAMGRGAIA